MPPNLNLRTKMEQHTQNTVSPEISASPEPYNVSTETNAPHSRQRCRARRRDRKQCRLFAQDPATGLCARHATYAETLDGLQDTTDLSKQLLVVNQGGYCTAESVNAILSNVVELLAKGRISSRRASVITFALSLLLRSVIVQDRQIANTPPQITWGTYCPGSSQDEPAANPHDNADASPQAHPQTSHDAMENYARRRT
jgi:hypothetical protein